MKTFTREEAMKKSIEYFNGDKLAADVFVKKYALSDGESFYELTPDDMHRRLAKEFARIEQKYENPLSEEEIYGYLKDFKYIVPQGSPMSAIGNELQVQSTSNCFISGTQIHTINDGIKNIEDVKIGDQVITHTGAIKTVSQLHHNSLNNRRLFRFKCFRTPEVVCTENHKFLSITKEHLEWGCQPQWNSMEMLRKGDYIAIPKRKDEGKENYILDISSISLDFSEDDIEYSQEIEEQYITNISHWQNKNGTNLSRKNNKVNRFWNIDENFAFFLGLWYGDGCVFSQSKKSDRLRGITFTFGAHEKDLIKFVSSYGTELFGINADVNEHLIDVDGSVQIVFHSTFIANVFRKLFGRGCSGKKVWNDLNLWSSSMFDRFLSGLISSDGTITRSGDVRVVMANRTFIKGIYSLARTHGLLLGYSESVSSNQSELARLDFPKNSDLLDLVQKEYEDDRLEESRNKQEPKNFFIEIEGVKFVQIRNKEICKENHETVYTIGVDDDHSYPVEGLVSLNCFVIPSPHDSYGGILLTDQELVQIAKRRGGIGFDISTIRPKGQRTNNAAKTTDGIGVFMERYSNSTREVAQNGRRGALMLTISVHHPEIRTFVNIKKDLTKVTGANISVRLSDEFMEAVRDDKDFELRWPVDSKTPEVSETINARELWDDIISNAHASAEPGLLFWDTAKEMTPSDAYEDVGFGSVSTNPCIIGDTLIAVADGRNAVSIKDLAQEGKDVPVYSTNIETGKVEIKFGRNPRKTGSKKEVWKLVLDDGTELIATPDHKILTKDLKYKELQDLLPKESIFPFNSFNSNGYRQICNAGQKMSGGARRNRRQYRLIHEFLTNSIMDAKKYAIHHKDFNSTNDCFENLEVMLHEDHKRLHADKMKGKNNPYHQMTDRWKANFASHPGVENGRYSGVSNEEILEHGTFLFEKHGKITNKLWIEYAKENNLPQFLANDFRFGTWKNFTNQVTNNHKVVSVEFYGYEDVYNITVDDNHNYHIITSNDDDDFVVSSGICVKNCGEIVLSPYDSCRLLLVNLLSFVVNPYEESAYFDFGLYSKTVQVAQRLMDDMIDLELEKIEKILAKIESDPEPEYVKQIEKDLWTKVYDACRNGRRTGLGVTAIGDAVAALGIRYGSEDSIVVVEEFYKQLALGSYTSSIIMAKERGKFPVFDQEKESGHPFINRVLNELPSQIVQMYEKHGRRNIANTTTAPAGSVSCLTQTTSGIEPAYLLEYTRRRKLMHNEEMEPDFVDDLGDRWVMYSVYHHGYKRWMEITGGSRVEDSPYYKATTNDLDWVSKVRMQAGAQKWICHAISNTTNVPAETTVETIKQIYMEGWKSGCKGVTVYRDGSRTGVLVQNDAKEEKQDKYEIILEDGTAYMLGPDEKVKYKGKEYSVAELAEELDK